MLRYPFVNTNQRIRCESPVPSTFYITVCFMIDGTYQLKPLLQTDITQTSIGIWEWITDDIHKKLDIITYACPDINGGMDE